MALKRHKFVDALAQAGDPIVLAAGNDHQTARCHALERLGEAQFVQAAMPTGKHKCHIKVAAFGLRGDDEPRRLQRAAMWPEALYEVKRGLEAFGRAKARFGAEKQGAIALSRQRNSLGLKGMEKRLQRFGGHCSISKRGLS